MALVRLSNKLTRLILSCLTAIGIAGCSKKISEDEISLLYASKLPTATEPLSVYHLGHSLVGRDMPAMLQQLAGSGHNYRSQLGWGATLQSHWNPKIPINGFEQENSHNKYRDAFEAIESQEYDAIVLTEMVEITAAIEHFDAARSLTNFAKKISQDSPNSHIYFYETWHEVTDPKGWMNRLDNDLAQYWEGEILHKALAQLDGNVPIYLIPAGQVFSAFFKELESIDGVVGIEKPEDIFAKKEDGSLDPIHINDLGSYFVAVIHYAVLYRKSPEGLAYQLKRADGTDATPPSEEAAKLMQKITWEVVSKMEKTGI